MEKCFYCHDSSTNKCDSCQLVTYCSDDHLDKHKSKSGECLPLKIEYQESRGRFCVATKDIKPFEIVLEDVVTAWGTYDDSKPLCLSCLNVADLDKKCKDCNLPFCGSEECENSPIHSPECQILRNHQPNKLEILNNHPVYALIAPLRIFQKRNSPLESDIKAFKQIMSLESHIEDLRKDRTQWDRVRCIILPILKACQLQQEDIDVIEQIIAIARTNSVDLQQRLEKSSSKCSSPGYAIFPSFSLLNHSCMANCRYHISSDNCKITVRAMRPIKKGEEITISYIGSTLGNIIRKQSFQRHWRFVCNCKRCQDPTEFGTYLQAIRCKKCTDQNGKGYMLPEYLDELSQVGNPKSDKKWVCNLCSHSISDLEVRVLLGNILEQTEFMNYDQSSEIWESLLDKIQNQVLHPNHYLCMNIKRSLIYIYGNKEKFNDPMKDIDKISRKLNLCQNYLEVYSKVDIGYTSWRGKLLEEMVNPLLLLNKIKLSNGTINQAEFLQCYKESVRLIKEATKCRQFEPENSNNFLGWCIKDANDAMSL